jgi:glycine oxidase
MTSAPTPSVVIVGGGIAGLATAYELALEGVAATVVEPDGLASHASGFAYGGLSGGVTGRPNANTPMMQEGMRLHSLLAERLPAETGVDTQYRRSPQLRLAFTQEELDSFEPDMGWRNAHPGFRAEVVDAEGARRIEPRVAPEALGGLYVEGSADLEPYRLSVALAQAAESRGAQVRTGRAVGLERAGGRVSGVRLEDGSVLACERAVLATGPWLGQAAAWCGLTLPIRPLKGQIIRLRAGGPPFDVSVGYGKDYAMTKPSDGLVWAGTTEEEAGFDESKTAGGRDEIIEALLRFLPSLADAELVLQTACLRPVSADGAVVVGPAPTLEGVVLVGGGGRQGIMMGPALGRTAAQVVLTGSSPLALPAYAPGRFA